MTGFATGVVAGLATGLDTLLFILGLTPHTAHLNHLAEPGHTTLQAIAFIKK